MAGYIVTAGRVTVVTDVGAGRAYVDVRMGELLPADVPAADVDELLRRGVVEQSLDAQFVDEPSPAEVETAARSDTQTLLPADVPAADVDELLRRGHDESRLDVESAVAEPGAVPDGPVAVVLAWVGEDARRAEAALTAERSAPVQRQTLIRQLCRLAGHGEDAV